MTEAVTLKGYNDCIVININEVMPYEKLADIVERKFKASKDFFNESTINIDFKGVELKANEYEGLLNLIKSVAKCDVKRFEIPNGIEMISGNYLNSIVKDNVYVGSSVEGLAKFHRGTVRSGQIVSSDGSVVIIGDVNPAAEIHARGNIIVLGSVKGIVHAGNKGDRDAVVVALNLIPTQLRIANIITRAPDNESREEREPEIAYINDGQIVIERYLQKRK